MNTQRSSSLFENSALKLVGENAEEIAQQFLGSLPFVKQPIEDLRNDPEWQALEVDYRIKTQAGKTFLIEVKSDRHIGTSGNVLFELCRIHHTANPEHCAYLGWSVFTQSHRILVWCPPAQQMFVFQSENLQRAMQGYTQAARKQTRLEIVETDSKRTTINILVPLSYVPYYIYQKSGDQWKLIGSHKATIGIHIQSMAA